MSAFAVTWIQNGMWFKIHCLEIIVLLWLFWYQLFFTPPHKLFYCSNWVYKNTFRKSTGNCEKVSIPRNGNVLILTFSKMTISRKIEAGRKRFPKIWLTTSLHDVCRDGGRWPEKGGADKKAARAWISLESKDKESKGIHQALYFVPVGP